MGKVKTKKVIKTGVDPVVLKVIREKSITEKQVIIHCRFINGFEFQKIRIWKTTYLYDNDSNRRSKLLNAYNIPLYPTWLEIKPLASLKFTLIFSGLPRHLTEFNLLEEIPQRGGFSVNRIQRNESDVYEIQVS